MTPLEAGLAAMDRLYFATHDVPNKPMVRARVRAMVRAYCLVWEEDNKKYKVNGAEKLLIGPLKNLDNMRDSGYLMSGKLDLLLEERAGRKRHILMDHKLMAQSFDDDDIEHLLISGQPLQYSALGWTNGIKFEAAIWDVLTKSSHVPSKESIKITPEKVYKRAYNGMPAGTVIPEKREVVPAETMDAFEERVYINYCENPQRYFARPEVPIIKESVAEHMHELYLWTKEIQSDAGSYIHLKNPGFCKDHNHWCEYRGLCSRRSHVDDGTWRYKTKEELHPELDLPPGVDPHKVITNSRASCFRGCRLKHHRKYNEGLVKIKEQVGDALFIGSAGHVAMEHIWKELGRQN